MSFLGHTAVPALHSNMLNIIASLANMSLSITRDRVTSAMLARREVDLLESEASTNVNEQNNKNKAVTVAYNNKR